MRRINTTNKATDLFGAGKHGWKNGVPGTADRPTEGQAEWFNAIQEELAGIVESSGAELSAGDNKQVARAITVLTGQVVGTIAALRNVSSSTERPIFVLGYYADGDGGGGHYWLDSTDHVSADDGGAVIVAADGGRWKLAYGSFISGKQFGMVGDGVTNDTARFDAAAALGVSVYLPYTPSGYVLADANVYRDNFRVFGDSAGSKGGTTIIVPGPNLAAFRHSASTEPPAATQSAPLVATQTAPPGRGELTH